MIHSAMKSSACFIRYRFMSRIWSLKTSFQPSFPKWSLMMSKAWRHQCGTCKTSRSILTYSVRSLWSFSNWESSSKKMQGHLQTIQTWTLRSWTTSKSHLGSLLTAKAAAALLRTKLSCFKATRTWTLTQSNGTRSRASLLGFSSLEPRRSNRIRSSSQPCGGKTRSLTCTLLT